ncbi:MAG: Rrf2 family transcriptional regulator [Planctomycetaceae bacterium]|nr:Rrf2 family transcriptional regulator [Planctomycetaceae bacterium]
MFSRTSDYALRAVCLIARSAGNSLTTDQIAAATMVPAAYLSKVLQALNRARIVQTQRGSGGGVSLALPADQVSVFEVVNAVAPFHRINSCPLGIAEHGTNLCPMHSQLDDALALIEQSFRSTSIADLLNPALNGAVRCGFPNVMLKS